MTHLFPDELDKGFPNTDRLTSLFMLGDASVLCLPLTIELQEVGTYLIYVVSCLIRKMFNCIP